MDIFKKIHDEIEKHKIITIFTHVHPDGDCYGSAHGFRELILDNFKGKKVYVLGDKLPTYIGFLKNPDTVDDETIKKSLAISVDTATQSRVFDQRFSMAKTKIKFDHHIDIEKFGDIQYVKISSSCCENISEFAMKMNYKISKKAAHNLFTGIITDNGRFRYRGVNTETFKIATKLMETGINPTDDIYPQVYEKKTADVKFISWYLANIKWEKNGFCYSIIEKETLGKFKLNKSECPSWLSNMSDYKGYDVWLQITYFDDYYRCEFRSKKYPVSEIATKFGGGGHRNASGARLATKSDVIRLLKYMKSIDFNK
jgi:phosphoesterase RecJ-like protein